MKIIKYFKRLFGSKPQDSQVIISRSEYGSMKETLHLLGSTKNAKRLFESLEEFNPKKTPTAPQ